MIVQFNHRSLTEGTLGLQSPKGSAGQMQGKNLGICPGRVAFLAEGPPVHLPGISTVTDNIRPTGAVTTIDHRAKRPLGEYRCQVAQFLLHHVKELLGCEELIRGDCLVQSEPSTEQYSSVLTCSDRQSLRTVKLTEEGLAALATDVGAVGNQQRPPGTPGPVPASEVLEPFPQFWEGQVDLKWFSRMSIKRHKYFTHILLQRVNGVAISSLTLFHCGASMSRQYRRHSL